MNIAFARTKYRKANNPASVEVQSSHEIIQTTLRELERSLEVLSAAQSAGNAFPSDHINRSFTAIYILQSSLDFEKGGDLAVRLFQLYEYCRLQTLRAFKREENCEMSQAHEAISGILSAWTDIAGDVDQGKGKPDKE